MIRCQVSEPAVALQVAEAERLLASERYLQLAELLLTSADAVLSKAPEKGRLESLSQFNLSVYAKQNIHT